MSANALLQSARLEFHQELLRDISDLPLDLAT
jgi:hypothetical protein